MCLRVYRNSKHVQKLPPPSWDPSKLQIGACVDARPTSSPSALLPPPVVSAQAKRQRTIKKLKGLAKAEFAEAERKRADAAQARLAAGDANAGEPREGQKAEL